MAWTGILIDRAKGVGIGRKGEGRWWLYGSGLCSPAGWKLPVPPQSVCESAFMSLVVSCSWLSAEVICLCVRMYVPFPFVCPHCPPEWDNSFIPSGK